MKTSVGQKKPLTKNQIKKIKTLLITEGNLRDVAMFGLSVDSMLRSCDLLNLKVGDLVDTSGEIHDQIDIQQQKTGKTVTIQVQGDTIVSLKKWIEVSSKAHNYKYLKIIFRLSNFLQQSRQALCLTISRAESVSGKELL